MMNIPHVEPALVQMPASMNTDIAAAVNLTCFADGYPPPSYQWFKDGVVIPGERKPLLYITEALPGDRGNYSCKASNSRGATISNLATVNIPGNTDTTCAWAYYFAILKFLGVYQYNVTLMLNGSSSFQAFDEVPYQY